MSKIKINKNALYKSTPEKLNYVNKFGGSNYHCKNFTFYPEERNGKWYMIDTYFRDFAIEVTEENFKHFEIVFDGNSVVQISSNEYYTISEKKRYHVAVDSGGRTYAKFFKDIGAKPLRNIVKKEKIEKIDFYKREIKCLENELLTIDTDERYEE